MPSFAEEAESTGVDPFVHKLRILRERGECILSASIRSHSPGVAPEGYLVGYHLPQMRERPCPDVQFRPWVRF